MSEWPMVKLGEVCKINPRRDKSITSSTEISFIEMKSLLENGNVHPVTVPAGKYLKGYTPFQKHDILIAKITPCFQNGKIGLANIDTDFGFGTTEFHVVRSDETLSPEYLTFFLRQQWILDAGEKCMTGSGGQRRVPKTFLENLKLPLPPLGEQKRIAEILGQTTKAISSVQNQIEQVKELGSSIVSAASKMAVELRAISEYFDINPRQPRNIPDNAPTSFVPMANLDETFGISPIASRFSEHKKGYTYFENGDILLAKITPCFENGKSAIAKLSTQIGHGSTEFHVLRHKNHMHQDACLSPLLAAAILKQPSFLKPAENFMRGSAGQKRIPVSYIASLKVPVLKSVDLEKIDQSLEIVEALLNLYHRKLSLLQELQKSLATRAFAGLL